MAPAINPITTARAANAWAPDVFTFQPTDVVQDALLMRAATLASTIADGDSPVTRVAYVDDGNAEFVREGAAIHESEPTMGERLLYTSKLSQLFWLSSELWRQAQTAGQVSESTRRALIRAADKAFISQPAPAGEGPEDWNRLTGLVNTPGILTGDAITTNLDPLADTLGEIEANGGTPSLIIANPRAWSGLRKLKTATGSNTSLLGAGTEDTGKRLLGVEVVTNAAVPDDTLLVIDPRSIVSAAGPVTIGSSEHARFDSDNVTVRAMWRIGWAVQHANRLAKLTVTAA